MCQDVMDRSSSSLSKFVSLSSRDIIFLTRAAALQEGWRYREAEIEREEEEETERGGEREDRRLWRRQNSSNFSPITTATWKAAVINIILMISHYNCTLSALQDPFHSAQSLDGVITSGCARYEIYTTNY
ncbi:hypothetical protein RRG08_008490 [Elysia crispata]|uniref:Uncharacterized protein n=1 Tax=Elysia crispata TaxID=231223 RepID=A0AAE1DC80_9GAST|nr:hypothetical protein RRG08_008490 [Elysia crispata]